MLITNIYVKIHGEKWEERRGGKIGRKFLYRVTDPVVSSVL
jgi:hypothetical protein